MWEEQELVRSRLPFLPVLCCADRACFRLLRSPRLLTNYSTHYYIPLYVLCIEHKYYEKEGIDRSRGRGSSTVQ